MKELVVASYMEPLDWVSEVPDGIKVTIYRATNGMEGSSRHDKLGKLKIIRIPNGGREAGQYLWHIISRWGSLADITIFAQGDFKKHGKLDQLIFDESLDRRQMAYLGVQEKNDRPWPFELQSLHAGIHDVWPKPPRSGMFSVGAQFWARKKLIKSVPLSIYKAYYAKRKLPHFAHILEGTWHSVFGVYR